MLDTVLKAGPKKLGSYYYKKAQKQKKLGGSSIKDACDLILFLASKYSDGINGKLISALWDDWKNFPKYKKPKKRPTIGQNKPEKANETNVEGAHLGKPSTYMKP